MNTTIRENFRVNHAKLNDGFLDFSGQSLTISDCKKLCKILLVDDIEEIRFTDCLLSEEISNGIINALAFNKNIKRINLKGNNMRVSGAEQICKLLKQTTSLTELYLEWNTLGLYDIGIVAISEGLAMNQSLRILDLSNNQICHKGGKELAGALRRNKTLHSLDLRWNNIGIAGGRELLQALGHNKKLVNLQLAGNNIPSDTIKAIAVAIQRNVDYHAMNEQHVSMVRTIKEKANHLHQEKALEVSLLANELEKEKELHQSFSMKTHSRLGEMKILVEELERENGSLKKQNSQLQSDIEAANRLISSLEENAASLNKTISSMREEHATVITKMEVDMNNERKQLHSDFSIKDHQIASLQENIRTLQESVESYSLEIGNLKAVLKTKKEEYETERSMLQQKHQKMVEWSNMENSDQVKTLNDKISRHVSDNDRLEAELSKLKATLMANKLKHEEEIVEHRSRWKQEETFKSKQYEERIDILVASKDELQAKVSKLMIQEAEIHTKLISYEKSIENYKRQNEHLEDSIKRRDQDHRDEINRLRLEIDNERRELNDMKIKMGSFQKKCQELNSELNEMKAAREDEVLKMKELIRSKEDELRRNQQEEMKRVGLLETAIQTYLTSARSNKY